MSRLSTREVRADLPQEDIAEYRFIARQPILDLHQRVVAYELLFRASPALAGSTTDPDSATLSTIDLSLLIDCDLLTDGLPAYINCTRELLVNGAVRVLPRDRAVLEILEDVPCDGEVLRACAELRRSGYRLAADDFDGDFQRLPLLELCDVVKVDFNLTSVEQQRAVAARLARRGATLLAEKVESREQFTAARTMGYRLFQGYFFCKPEVISTHDVPCLHAAHIMALKAAFGDRFEIPAAEKAISSEPSLCYRLLRYLNSVAFGLYPVRSIRHAITLLGQTELQKWIAIVSMVTLAGERSSTLIRLALHRARFMELFAIAVRRPDATEYFMTGIFSLLDTMTSQPLHTALAQLPIDARVKAALLGTNNELHGAFQLAIACESADWKRFQELCARSGCRESAVWDLFCNARDWVREIAGSIL